MRVWILFSFLIVLGFSCKRREAGEKELVYAGSIYVRYLNPEAYYTVQVEFGQKLSDSVLQKPAWTSVPAFNGFLLQERTRSEQTRFYAGEFTAPYRSLMQMELAQCPASLRRPALALSQPVLLLSGKTLQLGEDFVFSLRDDQLVQYDESLVILLIDSDQQAVNLEIKGPQPDHEFIIPAGFASSLKPGEVEFNLIKKKIYSLREGENKILVNLEYYAPPARIILRSS